MRKRKWLQNEFGKRGPTAVEVEKAKVLAKKVSAKLLALMEAKTKDAV